MKENGTWKMADVWNTALADREEREMKPRDHLWASELGAPPIDLFLKLKGTPYTNPANERALRKFEAGNVFEWIVSLVLKRAGILKDGQQYCEFQYDGLLRTTGKADFIAGGAINTEAAHEFIEWLKEAEIPDVFLRAFDRIVDYLAKEFPNGIEEMPLEVKSISSFAMDKLEKSMTAIPRHRKQIFHYLKAKGYKKALLIYLCRDDLRMIEFAVYADSPVEGEYKNAIEIISKYVKADEQPPKEKYIFFDEEYGKFTKNLGVEWSPYLTMLYGFQEPREYSEIYGKMASNWNRVMKRVLNNDKMTPKNLDVLKQIEEQGFDIEQIKPMFKMEAVVEEETVA